MSKQRQHTAEELLERLQNIEEEQSDGELDDSLDDNAETSIADDDKESGETEIPLVNR